jgi:hypothetical protein
MLDCLLTPHGVPSNCWAAWPDFRDRCFALLRLETRYVPSDLLCRTHLSIGFRDPTTGFNKVPHSQVQTYYHRLECALALNHKLTQLGAGLSGQDKGHQNAEARQ